MSTSGTVLARDGSLRLVREPGLVPWVADLLGRVEWGTVGPRYRLLDPDRELSTISADTHVLAAYEGSEPVGCYLWAPRTWMWRGRALHGYYRGLLAVEPDRLRRGYGRFLVEAARDAYLGGPERADFVYGYIEEDNLASLRLSEGAGYRSAGRFEAFIFSRSRRLCEDAEVRTDAPPELARAILEDRSPLLEAEVAAGLAEREHRWIAGPDGAVRAVVSAKPKRWRFTHLPGVSGWLAKTLGPRVPVVGRLFRPHDFRFVALGHVVEAAGAHVELERLLGHVLAEAGCPVALAFCDPRSALVARWRRRGAFGMLQSLGLGSSLQLMTGLRDHLRPLWVELEAGPLPLALRDDA